MPRQRKKTDRGYITNSEWARDFGGKKKEDTGNSFRPLPFDCCALSLAPFETPVCTRDGVVYELTNIIPFVRRYGVDPATGRKMARDDLVSLHFHRNAESGRFQCPVLFKEFTEHTKIAAVRTSGNVFSFEAIDQLNLKAGHMKDLLTGTEFAREDVIIIHDPQKSKNVAEMFYVREGQSLSDAVDDQSEKLTSRINMSSTTERTIRELHEKERKEKGEDHPAPQAAAAAAATTATESKPVSQRLNAQAPGFTSSTFSAKVVLERDPTEVPKKTKRKGYVSLQTNMGTLNIEVHCDLVPLASENFLTLCERGYFDGTKFHRSVKNFMIQGGDPKGTGRGGESIWGKPFRDEFKSQLKHDEAGIVSMANAGSNTNGSQFFILYKPAPHLDGKHAVFGRVVGGLDILKLMEQVPTDGRFKPTVDIVIEKAVVFVNPFNELEQEQEEERRKEEEKKRAAEARWDESNRGQWYSNPVPELPKTSKTGVGKYLGLLGGSKSAVAKTKTERAPAAGEDKPIDFRHESIPELPKKKPRGDGFESW